MKDHSTAHDSIAANPGVIEATDRLLALNKILLAQSDIDIEADQGFFQRDVMLKRRIKITGIRLSNFLTEVVGWSAQDAVSWVESTSASQLEIAKHLIADCDDVEIKNLQDCEPPESWASSKCTAALLR
jgi:hypothetical protein